MYVHADTIDDEIGQTVDAAVELANVLSVERAASLDDPTPVTELRRVLVDHGFPRARRAEGIEIERFAERFAPVATYLRTLPEATLESAVVQANSHLGEYELAPSLSGHDDFPLHIHWTSAEAPFADQVVVDIIMAVAQTLCDHGTARFGRCRAEGCERLFFDSSKNRSRRFCSDARCASRTHTAAHRARERRDA